MKNNELTEVKSSMPSLEGLPQEVIEYVHGLVAENAALKDINAWCRTDAFQNMYREFKIAEAAGCSTVDCMHDAMLTAIMHAPATPATDAAIAEIKASELDDLAKSIMEYAPVIEADEYYVYEAIAKDVTDRAANLRAGRKG